jgi:4-oxalocrotonate tautomerase
LQAARARRTADGEMVAMSDREFVGMDITRRDTTHVHLCPIASGRTSNRWGFSSTDSNERTRAMPHLIVKLQSGRAEQQKARIADEVTKAVMATANCAEDALSVCIEDVAATDWTEKVYKPDIIGNSARLYKKPGYDPR